MTRTRGTQAAIVAVAISVGLLFLSASTRDGWLVLLAGLGLGLVVAAVVLRPRLQQLDVSLVTPARARARETVDTELVVTNGGRRTSVPFTVTVVTPLLETGTVRVPALRAGGDARAKLPILARLRGELTDVEVTIHTTAPFSLVSVTRRVTVPASLLIHPAPGRALATPPGGAGEGHAAPTPGGVEVHGIREWHRGEPTGRLYARGTARHGRPLVLDRHDDSGDALAVFVAGPDDGTAETASLQEAMIAVVAATLVERSTAGRDVVALTGDTTLSDVTGGDTVALLDWCARLGQPGRPPATVTPDGLARAARAVGDGGHVVLAQLSGLVDRAALARNSAAVDGAGATLLVLHRFPGRTDALGLQDARTYLAAGAQGTKR